MRTVIVANGTLPLLPIYAPLVHEADLVIAADGGANGLLNDNFSPQLIVGDMDSIDPSSLENWLAHGGETITFPTEKDETDLELALSLAQDRGATQIALLGALGGRPDHALANTLLLVHPDFSHLALRILDAETEIAALKPDGDLQSLTLIGEIGDLVTLLPVTTNALGLTTTGLYYPLENGSLTLGSPRGVSNVMTTPRATISCQSGALLVFRTTKSGHPLSWW